MSIAECDYWFHRGRATGMREVSHALDRAAADGVLATSKDVPGALRESADAARDMSIQTSQHCDRLVREVIASRGTL